jgi:hypothetical protein
MVRRVERTSGSTVRAGSGMDEADGGRRKGMSGVLGLISLEDMTAHASSAHTAAVNAEVVLVECGGATDFTAAVLGTGRGSREGAPSSKPTSVDLSIRQVQDNQRACGARARTIQATYGPTS